jgi:hypothetical protein
MTKEVLQYIGILAGFILMIFVVRARRRQHRRWLQETADREVCPHLKPALEELRRRGHRVERLGQRAVDFPLEIHIGPAFDPAELLARLRLAPPVHLSERRVLCCRECWCELCVAGT